MHRVFTVSETVPIVISIINFFFFIFFLILRRVFLSFQKRIAIQIKKINLRCKELLIQSSKGYFFLVKIIAIIQYMEKSLHR